MDPVFPAAHAALAIVYALKSSYGYETSEEGLADAEQAARCAIELEPSLGLGHIALGALLFWEKWDWEGARRAYSRAIELKPGDAEARLWYSGYLHAVGRSQDALAEMSRAHDLDPLLPIINDQLAWAYFLNRDYEAAIRYGRQTMALFPFFRVSRSNLAQAYLANGQPSKALGEYRELVRPTEIEALESSFSAEGEKGLLRWLVARLLAADEAAGGEGRHRNRAVSLAVFHGRLGHSDEALDWLEESARRHEGWLVFIKSHPWLDCARSDPRYGQLLKSMGL